MFCSNCGTKVGENDVFCPECGARIVRPAAAAEREPLVIEQPHSPVYTPAAPVTVPVTEPAVPKKKSRKGLIIGIIAGVAAALGLAAAAIFWLVPMLRSNTQKNARDAVVNARTAMEDVNSLHMDMTMDMNVSLGFLNQSQDIDMQIRYTGDTVKEPAKSHFEMQGSAMGQAYNMLFYSEIVDGENVTYASADGGVHWTMQAVSNGNVDQDKLLSVFMEHAEDFKKTGTETVNGSSATVYSCELNEQYVKDALTASGMTESLGEVLDEIGEDVLNGLGPIPMTMSVDDKTGYPVHITMDLTTVISNLFKNLMNKAMEQSGMSGIEIKIEVKTCMLDMVLSKFNEADFEIPEEVKNPPEVAGEGIVGTWNLVDGEGDEAKETVQMLLTMGASMTFTFNEDGTGSMTYVFSGDSASESFDYTLEDGQIVIEGDGADYTLDGDRLTIEVEGYVLVFERQ